MTRQPHHLSTRSGSPSPSVTLASLSRASPFLSLTAVAKAAGIPRQTLFTRLRRGGPELSVGQAQAVVNTLAEAGITLESGLPVAAAAQVHRA